MNDFIASVYGFSFINLIVSSLILLMFFWKFIVLICDDVKLSYWDLNMIKSGTIIFFASLIVGNFIDYFEIGSKNKVEHEIVVIDARKNKHEMDKI